MAVSRRYREERDSMIRSYRRTLEQLQQAVAQTAAALQSDPESEATRLRDLQLLAEMGADVAAVIQYLHTGEMPPAPRSSRNPVVTVAEIPPGARPVVPAGIGDGERLAAALSNLTPRQREVLVLVEGQGLSLTDVADYLGITRQAVHRHLRKARIVLSTSLSASNPETRIT